MAIVISEAQRNVHITAEAAALALTVPFAVYAAKNLPTRRGRNAAAALAVATVLVDGALLISYLRKL